MTGCGGKPALQSRDGRDRLRVESGRNILDRATAHLRWALEPGRP